MHFHAALLAICLGLGLGAAHAQSPADQLIGQIEGVYKHRFQNGLVTGEKYQSEDVVEIVRYDDSRIYVTAELQFSNGHECSISGIARYDGGKFVYDAPSLDPDTPACHFQVGADGKAITFGDPDDACRFSRFGARGVWNGYTIARDSKRTIRYMDRLRNSPEYKQAVSELKK